MKDEFNNEATYLGDGVYAVLDKNINMVRLTTNSHRVIEADNEIYLEPKVFQALVDFAKRINWLKETK